MLFSLLMHALQADAHPHNLVREVCVINATSEFQLGYLLMGNSSNTSRWVYDNGHRAVVPAPFITESTHNSCATITLNHYGEMVKFNGYAANSAMWHKYFVGKCPYGNDTCAVGDIYVDSQVDGQISQCASRAIPCDTSWDYCWTDH